MANHMDRYFYKPFPFSSHLLLIDEFSPVGNGQRVLDVGCGRGYLARILAKRGYKVTGVDMDREALKIARQYCCEVIETDLQNWTGPEGRRFDYLLFGDVLEHLSDPVAFIQRLMPFLNEHGVVVLSVPNVAHLYVRLSLLLGRWNYAERGILDRTHVRFFTRASLARFLNDSGIHPRRIKATSLPWPIIFSAVPERWLYPLLYIERLAVTMWPTLFAYQWIASGTPAHSKYKIRQSRETVSEATIQPIT